MIVVILLYIIASASEFPTNSSVFSPPGEKFDSWTHAQSNLLFIADQRDFSFSTRGNFSRALARTDFSSDISIPHRRKHKRVQLTECVIFDSAVELKSNSHAFTECLFIRYSTLIFYFIYYLQMTFPPAQVSFGISNSKRCRWIFRLFF